MVQPSSSGQLRPSQNCITAETEENMRHNKKAKCIKGVMTSGAQQSLHQQRIHQEKFFTPEYAKSWVLKSIGRKWSNFKSNLKRKHYKKYATDIERQIDRDDQVLPEQWYYLIQFWNSDKGQERSNTNTISRSKQKYNYTEGSKSFAEYARKSVRRGLMERNQLGQRCIY
ncbi:uncharacterized protein LOC132311119 [Cornus florida]|uniref:uncharacterized protein LOC132311119 n=1 Tax=Cornus florida TaxID=4283 RepID=UPI00289DC950|nr:uncharacterized protein LOC132311119 [Cornus florida]XP_059664837.1 uncharacterized protein LOC132311119 [Cornus florida]XP_059664838.1 uncharacterized protein LOC132311119 [Cornus florida]